VVRKLRDAGVRVSLFIDPDPVQVAVAEAIGAQVIELHTGAWCEAARVGAAQRELDALKRAVADGARRGLEIHAGHGLDYDTVGPVAALPEVRELNIGHFLIGEAIFVGLDAAIRGMRQRIDAARGA
jgi:pyridoxine 5-phosphate synthase